MKRTHHSSNLTPYQLRLSNQQTDNKTARHSHPPQNDILSDLPAELLFQIFILAATKTPSTYQCFRSLAFTQKKFHQLVISTEFGTAFTHLQKIPLKTCPNEPWIKTYKLWLQTRCYILLDCSNSMDVYANHEKVEDAIKKISQQAFQYQWWKKIKLGLFADEFIFIPIESPQHLKATIENIDTTLEYNEFTRINTYLVPVLKSIYNEVNNSTSQIAAATEVHILSDCKFTEAEEIKKQVFEIKCYRPLSIHWYKVTKNGKSPFLDDVQSWLPTLSKTTERASVSIIEDVDDFLLDKES